MKLWVDADACPAVIREILYKAAERTQTRLILVANRNIRIPKSRFIEFLRVQLGLDVADNTIIEKIESGDLVITSDIPLAAKVVQRGGLGLNPRGEIYSSENISEILSNRDFMDSLRSSGVDTGGPPPLTNRDKQTFANSLDQVLAKFKKSK
ncbi:MAG: YaiI/YqxD family protein [Desulfocapsaceae bacterium]|nr:YaiI/YqxD family protein [Desulfocapsaceae bacterium]